MAVTEGDKYGNYGLGEIRMSSEPEESPSQVSDANIVAKIARSEHSHPLQRVAKALDNAQGSLTLQEASNQSGMKPKELVRLSQIMGGVFKYDGARFYSPLYKSNTPPVPQSQR